MQDYFNYIIKNHEKVTDNLPRRIYINKIENTVAFRLKIGYYLQPITPETMKMKIVMKMAKVCLI